MKQLGLIGHPLTHSFSAEYFQQKFQKLDLSEFNYQLFDLPDLSEVKNLEKRFPSLIGLNVTVPYKEKILDYLDYIDTNAAEIGAVNCIKIESGRWEGYNTDYYGFKESISNMISPQEKISALVLGSGGSSKAIQKVLRDIGIVFQVVSRREEYISYVKAKSQKLFSQYKLIINTTPLGMYPKTDSFPPIDYDQLSSEHLLFDLVYNPEKTTFLKNGEKKGAATKNGLEMLYIQADRAWEIWTGGIE